MNIHDVILEKYQTGNYSIPQLWKACKLISEGTTCFFLGEVSAKEAGIWTGDELAKELGLMDGTSQHSDTPWLKFLLDGELIIIPKKTIRYNLSWDSIQDVNAVYGSRIIEKHGYEYRITLLKGATTDPILRDPMNGFDIQWSHGSEWNRTMYHIHDGNHTNTRNTLDSERIMVGDLATYSDEELNVHFHAGNGSASWCQETPFDDPTRRVYRGYYGISVANAVPSLYTGTVFGWRPALRRIN